MEFKGWDGLSYSEFNLVEESGKTNVSWDFESGTDMPFLFRGFAVLSGMKKGMRRSYKEGLKNLKELAEKRANEGIYNGYKIREIVLGERNFVMKRQEVRLKNIQQYYSAQLGSLFALVQQTGIEMEGKPCGLYFRFDRKQGITDMAAAIPVKAPVNIEGATSYYISARKAVQVDYYGDYKGAGVAHDAIERYLKDKDYLQDVPVIEEYITDPGEEKDPNKWKTVITYYFSERG